MVINCVISEDLVASWDEECLRRQMVVFQEIGLNTETFFFFSQDLIGFLYGNTPSYLVISNPRIKISFSSLYINGFPLYTLRQLM